MKVIVNDLLVKKHFLQIDLTHNATIDIHVENVYTKNEPSENISFHVKSSEVFLLSSINLTLKVNLFKPFTWKILFNSIRN